MKTGLFFTLLFAQSHFSAANDNAILRRQTASSVSATATTSVWTRPTDLPPLTVNSTELDLSKHFCRLWRHQSVYADGKIYIDGGNTYVPDDNTTFNTATSYVAGMNDMLLVLDLSQNFTNQDTFPYSVVHKGPDVPNALIEGALWYSSITRKVYQLGGWFSYNSKSDPGFVVTPLPPAIWEFDVDKQTFAQSVFTLNDTGVKIERPGAAAYCDAPSLNKNFIFEGYVEARSDPAYISTYGLGSSIDFKFLEGMLQLDTNTSPPTLTNISVPTYIGQRMNGAMIHVPVGPQGVIVQIAGQEPQFATEFGVQVIGANGKNTNINNTYVDIYDIETGFWFRQPTFGAPTYPDPRSDICTVLITAPDNSSYNIFMIAGVQTYDGIVLYEDMWVLTLPTFQWVKVHSRPGGYFGHSCHAVGENVVIIGGMQVGTDNKNYANCTSHMPAEIFSLVELEYTGVFDFAGASRTPPVPAAVVDVVGGTSTGGAVNVQPIVWADTYLQAVFNPSLTRPANYKPTYTLAADNNGTAAATHTSTPGSKAPIGAIVGGAVGGIVVLAILGAVIFICLKKRKVKTVDPRPGHSELPSYQDTKDATAREVASYQHPLQFTPYQPYPQRDPAEMDAHDDESADQFRPLSENAHERSPAMRNSTRFSEVSVASVHSPVSEGGRLSRQSEVSE